jgi:hypothetical protein
VCLSVVWHLRCCVCESVVWLLLRGFAHRPDHRAPAVLPFWHSGILAFWHPASACVCLRTEHRQWARALCPPCVAVCRCALLPLCGPGGTEDLGSMLHDRRPQEHASTTPTTPPGLRDLPFPAVCERVCVCLFVCVCVFMCVCVQLVTGDRDTWELLRLTLPRDSLPMVFYSLSLSLSLSLSHTHTHTHTRMYTCIHSHTHTHTCVCVG